MSLIFEHYTPPDWSCGQNVNGFEYLDEDMYAVKYIGASIKGYLQKQRRLRLGIIGNGKYNACPSCGVGFIKDGSGKRTCPICSSRPTSKAVSQTVCVRCGVLFSSGSKARTTMWCPDCREEVRREQTRMRVAKFRRRCNAFKWKIKA